MPIDYRRYPDNWRQISQNIRNAAGNRCQRCGVPNHAHGYRDKSGAFHPWPVDSDHHDNPRMITIILTVAHLDHDTNNNDPANLQALCQRCHLAHDLPHHIRNAHRTRRQRKLDAGQHELNL